MCSLNKVSIKDKQVLSDCVLFMVMFDDATCIPRGQVDDIIYIIYWTLLILALSPGHSHVFNVTPPFLRVTLKTWEWPGDKAT